MISSQEREFWNQWRRRRKKDVSRWRYLSVPLIVFLAYIAWLVFNAWLSRKHAGYPVAGIGDALGLVFPSLSPGPLVTEEAVRLVSIAGRLQLVIVITFFFILAAEFMRGLSRRVDCLLEHVDALEEDIKNKNADHVDGVLE